MKLQTTITEEMNNKILEYCKIIGCTKNDFVRFALMEYMLGVSSSPKYKVKEVK